ncbi:UDP-N-acetylmuramate--L-alanine ligase [Natronospora cellulosivora (SeqCode)]
MNDKKIHFIGIGGISMSGIAKILLKQGYNISGSDLNDSHHLEKLRNMGGEIYIGHKKENVPGADLVVISSAIPLSNPELKYAYKNKIPVLKRAQMIAELMKNQKGIAISGTHGKTTTTSMIASVMLEATDPTILIGGELDLIGGNVYLGKGDYLITEADESDGSFLYYDPEIVVVTNVEMDHHDYYQSEEQLFETFRNFINKVPNHGKAILCTEDKKLMNLIDERDKRIITYGIDSGDIQARNCKLFPFGSIYQLCINGVEEKEINLKIPGRHNILNSLAAIAVAKEAGMKIKDIKVAIEEYSGVHRRFEKKGLLGDILIVDDYAHHPTEVEATLQAAYNTGYERTIAIFQPHRYSRTKHLINAYNDSFNFVDHLIVTDIYSAGEKEIPGVSAEELAKNIAKNNKFKVDYIADLKDVVKYLRKIVRHRDLVITMGAGDVYLVGESFLKLMKKGKEMA